jgi:polyphosphate kinase
MKLPVTHRFLNREVGILEFNRRVLAQAEDPHNPLLERLKFLCIVSRNLDEFFEVRVAWLKENMQFSPNRLLPDGMTAAQAFELVAKVAQELVARQYRVLREMILPALKIEGITFLCRSEWTESQREWVYDYFCRELKPILTPIGLDPSHPFPRLLNKSLNFIVELTGKDAFGRNSGIAIVQAPRILPRFIKMPSDISGVNHGLVFLSSMLHAHVEELFAGMTLLGCHQFRVTRDSEVSLYDEDIKDLRKAIEGGLSQRQYGDAVRLEVATNCPAHIQEFLLQQFALCEKDLYCVDGPVNLGRLIDVPNQIERPDLLFIPFTPSLLAELKKNTDIFKQLQKQDILLHHPFQSFIPVIELLQQAAQDPNVVAIKMTVYRTGNESALMEALIEAAVRGKEVTVVVELMARFDEAANINWSAQLEKAGVHVVYGVYGYKTHAKMLVIIRREAEGKLRRYVHIGTGNYHSHTAKLYSDFGLMTCNEEICNDVSDVFAQLTGFGQASKLTRLWQSPFTMQAHLFNAIDQEIAAAQKGKKAVIIAKMNALLANSVIEKLYYASQQGVIIHLIVRGVCALRPQVPGLSDNIRVRSIVGRFLEHSRIYYFWQGGMESLYLASADWMGRNLFRRIEIAVPILSPAIKKRIIREGLRPYLVDNTHAWEMQPNGHYRHKTARTGKKRCAQESLLDELTNK